MWRIMQHLQATKNEEWSYRCIELTETDKKTIFKGKVLESNELNIQNKWRKEPKH